MVNPRDLAGNTGEEEEEEEDGRFSLSRTEVALAGKKTQRKPDN